MKRFQTFIVASLLFSIALASRAQSTDQPGAVQKTEQAVDNATALTKKQLKEIKKKADAQYQELGKKLDDVKAKAQKETGQAKADIDKTVADGQQKYDDLKLKLEKLKTATSEKWSDAKTSFDRGVDEMKKIIP